MQWRGMPRTWGAVAGVGRDGRGTDSVTYSKNLNLVMIGKDYYTTRVLVPYTVVPANRPTPRNRADQAVRIVNIQVDATGSWIRPKPWGGGEQVAS